MVLLVLNSNTWNYLTLCKQMISIKLDRNTWLKELLMLNSNTSNYFAVQMINNNTWNHLTVCNK